MPRRAFPTGRCANGHRRATGVYGNRIHRELCSNPPPVLKTGAPTRGANTPRKTGQQSTFWFTKAGGDTCFGNAEEVSIKEAKKRFADHLLKLQDDARESKAR